ncbi:tyrosine-type recombinase/integrase [Rubritalea profundi]|uniref:Tyr recombinase domain-containing protein n=1 Tax=Rubritalea profundi TaxID=1658618 RepID=A0A2S7U159_9BACT|nr:hypothetical protein [Rubritalea profundi]PQJ27913.1 hypothetical protein BSZ32_04965 [Rubritalea profundi]
MNTLKKAVYHKVVGGKDAGKYRISYSILCPESGRAKRRKMIRATEKEAKKITAKANRSLADNGSKWDVAPDDVLGLRLFHSLLESGAIESGTTLAHVVNSYTHVAIAKANKVNNQEAIDEFMLSLEKRTGTRHVSTIRGALARWAKFKPSNSQLEIGKLSIGKTTRAHAEEFLDLIKVPITRNAALTRTSSLYSWLISSKGGERILESDNPYKAIEHVRIEHTRPQSHSPEDVATFLGDGFLNILDAIPFALGFALGLRTSEIERLDWSDIELGEDCESSLVRVSGKTGYRAVPINEMAFSFIELVPAENRIGKITEYRIENARNKATARSGVAILNNGMRKTCITYSAALNGIEATATACGNSPSVIRAHYDGLATKALSKEYFSYRAPATYKQNLSLFDIHGI